MPGVPDGNSPNENLVMLVPNKNNNGQKRY